MCTVRAGGKGNSEEALSRKAAPTPSPCACPDALQQLLGLPKIVTATRWGGGWSTVWHLPALAQGHGLGGPAACPGWQQRRGGCHFRAPQAPRGKPPTSPRRSAHLDFGAPPDSAVPTGVPTPPPSPPGFLSLSPRFPWGGSRGDSWSCPSSTQCGSIPEGLCPPPGCGEPPGSCPPTAAPRSSR